MREMKDSGNVFIGNIPQDWRLMRLKFCLAKPLRSGTTDEPMEYSSELPRYIRISDIDKGGNLRPDTKVAIPFERAKGYILEDDTVLFASCGGTVGKAFLYKKEMGFSTYASYLIAAQANSAKVLPEWIYYFSKSATYFEWLQCSFTQSTIQNINSTKYGNLPLAVPEVSVQKRIIAYLDRKCADIDNVLEKTKASIEEYRKLKQSVITETVTKGVRGPRPMKDSGIEWVEKLPVEWTPINPKALFTLRKDKAFKGERQLAACQNYGIIYQDDYMALTGAKVVTVEKDFDILKHVERGDFVISMRSFQGGLEYSENTGSISSAYVMLIPVRKRVYDRYFRWLFKSQIYIDALKSTSNMVRDGQAMRYSNFSQVRLFSVPIEEQQEIASYLDQKCSEIDSLIESKERFIKELEAYRKSLIYEYVTGKKEVPA